MKLKLEYLLVALLVMLIMCRSKQGREGFGNGTTPAFTLYHVDWCGHCKRAKPEFQKLDDHYAADGYKRLVVRQVDCEDPVYKAEVSAMNVRGYPTMYFHPGGSPDPKTAVKYEGPRTYAAMHAFVEQRL